MRSGCSQREFSRRIALEPTKLSKSLNGQRRFTAHELARVAEVGGVGLDWLLHGDDTDAGADDDTRADRDADTGAVGGDDTGAVGEGTRVPSAGEGSRRATIVDAASGLIAERGYHRVRVSDIARRCGTSPAAIHYHFPVKQDLLNEALVHCMRQAFARQQVELRGLDDARDQLLRLIELQLPRPGHVAREWSIWLQFWSEAMRRDDVRAAHQDFYARWGDLVVRLVRRGQEQGVFRDVDAERAGLRFTALMDGLALQVLTGSGDLSVDAMRDLLLDHLERDLLARPVRTAS